MRKSYDHPAGQVHALWLNSAGLQQALPGDARPRRIDVYVPYGHSGAGLPLLVDLAAFLSGGPAHSNWRNFGENLCERLDRLIGEGSMPPVVVAMPDCFTRLGGNQYINSSVMGPWADILREEVVPQVEARFGCGGPGRRGVFGKSSGGYGALVHGLLYPDFWSGVVSHSGDVGFELMFGTAFPDVLRALAGCNNSVEQWLAAFEAKRKQRGEDLHVLMLLAMCASFDPDPTQPFGIRLPVDGDTCEWIPERWQNWLRWDPLRLAEQQAEGLLQLKLFWFDCGTADQYNLLYGNRRLHRLLDERGIPHGYEEFPDNHSSTDYRLDRSLPLLAAALSE